MAIDDLVENKAQLNDDQSGLEKKLEEKTGIFQKFWDMTKYTALMSSVWFTLGSTIALSTYIVAGGLVIGGWKESRNEGKRFTWKKFYRELYSGNMIGLADYAIFSVPDLLMSLNPAFFGANKLFNMLVKTAILNPVFIVPYNFAYQTFIYLRDKVGWGSFFKGLLTGKAMTHLKEAYQNKVRKDITRDTWNVFKVLFPLHFIQSNYLPNPTLRMGQSLLINNPVYRLIMGGKKKKKSTQDYNSMQPQYA